MTAAVVAVVASVTSVVVGAPPAAAAPDAASGYATGGSGRFKGDIQWIQWGTKDTVLLTTGDRGSRTITNTRDLGAAGEMTVTCTISELTAVANEGNGWAIRSGLKAYTPGDWAGDSLDDLYNVGGAGYWNTRDGEPGSFPSQYVNPNQMVIGLRNVEDHARMRFNYTCGAKLNGQGIPLQGLVFADAEASSNSAGNGQANQAEWIAATPTGGQQVSWYLLDRHRNQGCRTNMQLSLGGMTGTTMRMDATGQECVYAGGGTHGSPSYGSGPGGVMFMKGGTSATVEIQGRGYTAVALGVVVETDFGDAPASYGVAGSLYQPQWLNGTVLSRPNTSQNMWSMTLADNSGDRPAGVHLGRLEDPESQPLHTTDATGDDTSGVDDEDGLDNASIRQGGMLPTDVLNGTNKTFRISNIACSGDGHVQGWIDWDGNGLFDADEGSDSQSCSSATTLTFTVPDAPVNTNLVNKASTFLRVRAYQDAADPGRGSTGVTLDGEVEDYRLSLPPQLSLVKQVTNAYGGTAKNTDWTLTATGPAPTGALTIPTGQTRYVTQGSYALAESPQATSGYEWASLSCRQTPAGQTTWTNLATTKDTPSVRVPASTNVECTFVNRDRPGTLTWGKVDPQGVPLPGSTWMLSGPSFPDGTVVDDCEREPCPAGDYRDQDPNPGAFKLTGLKWGDYTIRETKAPTGYQMVDDTFTFPALGATKLESSLSGDGVDNGNIINTPVTGSVSWQKVDEQTSAALSGSSWTLTGPELPADGITVTDCTAAPCPTGAVVDTDSTPGSFTVTGLAWSLDQYTLVEATAPVGYLLDTTPHTFTISIDHLDHSFAAAFTNKQVPVPNLPLTGGLGADYFLIGGAGLAALAGGLGIARRRAKRQTAR